MRMLGKAFAGGPLACLMLLACGKTVPLEANTTCPCAGGWSCCDGNDGGVGICRQGSCSQLDYMEEDKVFLFGTSWYAYSDRTCPLTCPPAFYAGATGSLSPQEAQPFFPVPEDRF